MSIIALNRPYKDFQNILDCEKYLIRIDSEFELNAFDSTDTYKKNIDSVYHRLRKKIDDKRYELLLAKQQLLDTSEAA